MASQSLSGGEKKGKDVAPGSRSPHRGPSISACGSAGFQRSLPACQSNPEAWKFKRGQKEADFKTHL